MTKNITELKHYLEKGLGISGAFSKEEGLNAACVVIEIIQ